MDVKDLSIKLVFKNRDGQVIQELTPALENLRDHLQASMVSYIDYFKQPPSTGMLFKDGVEGYLVRLDEIMFEWREKTFHLLIQPVYYSKN